MVEKEDEDLFTYHPVAAEEASGKRKSQGNPTINFRIPPADKAKVEQYATARGLKISDVMRNALDLYLRHPDAERL